VSETDRHLGSLSKLAAAIKTALYFVALLIAAPFIAIYFGLSLLWYRLNNRPGPLPAEITASLSKGVSSLAQFPTAETLTDAVVTEVCAARPTSLPQSGVIAALRRTARTLCETELPTVPTPPDQSDATAMARYSEALEQHVDRAADTQYLLGVTNALVAMGLGLVDALPPSARQAPEDRSGRGIEQKMPLIDILPDPAAAIAAVLSPFRDQRASSGFSALRAILQRNLARMQQIEPADFRGTRRELVENYLGDTPLVELFEVEIPIVIPKAA